MNIDISKTADFEIQTIIDTMIDNGWKQEDEAYVNNIIDINDKEVKVNIVFFPKLLSYTDGNNWITVPWICGRWFWDNVDTYVSNEIDVLSEMKYVIKEHTGLTPFKDEDAICGWLARGHQKAFFINPDYPDGYWENHVL